MDRKAITAFTPGDALDIKLIGTSDAESELDSEVQGRLKKYNLDQDSMTIQTSVFYGFDGKVEREILTDIKFSEIESITRIK